MCHDKSTSTNFQIFMELIFVLCYEFVIMVVGIEVSVVPPAINCTLTQCYAFTFQLHINFFVSGYLSFFGIPFQAKLECIPTITKFSTHVMIHRVGNGKKFIQSCVCIKLTTNRYEFLHQPKVQRNVINITYLKGRYATSER